MRFEQWIRILPLRLRSLLRRGKVEQELDDELHFHLERQIEQHIAAGLSPEAARRAALVAIGGVEQRKEESRDTRGVHLIENFVRDLRYALRGLRQNPRFAAVATLTVTLGVAVNTTLFNLANPIIFKPLPYPQSADIVRIYRTSPELQQANHSIPSFLEYREKNTAFTEIAAFDTNTARIAEPGEPAERIYAMSVTAGFFPLLGIPPRLGRVFNAEEERPGAEKVVVLGHIFWRERFGSDPNIIGRTLRLEGENVTVIGVMPEDFEYAFLWGTVHLFRPFAFTPQQRNDQTNQYLRMIGRLKPGVSITQAGASMKAIAAQRPAVGTDRGESVSLERLQRTITSDLGRQLFAFSFGLTVLVLFIACVNLANLQLARTAARAREFALRGVLGGSRGRLLQQSLTESLLISLLGGVAAALLSVWLTTLITRRLFAQEPNIHVTFDVTVFGFTLFCSLAAGLLFGSLPAWLASRRDPNDALKQTARGVTAARAHNRLRHALIVTEVAFVLIVLTAAAGLIRNMQQRLTGNPGWNMDGLLLAGLKLDGAQYASPQMRADFLSRLEQRLGAIPGIERVALSSLPVPTSGFLSTNQVFIEGRSDPPAPVVVNPVTATYFETLGIPLAEGRAFTAEDRLDRMRVAIINEGMARRLWPNESPIGKRISLTQANPNWLEIVGIARDVRYLANLGGTTPELQVYQPFAQVPRAYVNAELRTSLRPEVIAPELRRVVAELDRELPVYDIRTARAQVEIDLEGMPVLGNILGGFAMVGMMLCAIGVFGVISYSVSQRTGEIGIRMALGARNGEVVWFVLKKGLALTFAGTAIGCAGAVALARLIAATLSWLPTADWLTTLAVAAWLIAVAAASCYIPARRAARIDPTAALRHM